MLDPCRLRNKNWNPPWHSSRSTKRQNKRGRRNYGLWLSERRSSWRSNKTRMPQDRKLRQVSRVDSSGTMMRGITLFWSVLIYFTFPGRISSARRKTGRRAACQERVRKVIQRIRKKPGRAGGRSGRPPGKVRGMSIQPSFDCQG